MTTVNIGSWFGAAATLGQKLMGGSIPVVLASDQAALPVTPAAATPISVKSSVALDSSLIIKAAPGTLYKCSVQLDTTLGAGLYYAQLFNSATVPADGVATIVSLPPPIAVNHAAAAAEIVAFDISPQGILFSAGIIVVLSSTQFVKTLTAARAIFTGQFV